MNYRRSRRVVLTLDAGGTNFYFSAIRGGEEVVAPIRKASHGHDLSRCLSTIIGGFSEVMQTLSPKPDAISFAFPGPADYPRGIIDDLENLPGFRGGVPLGPLLEEKFKLPVFINNDGNLFALGEAEAGLLPEVNCWLREKGCEKQFGNLFGITLGTGFGGGVVHRGKMMIGDNSAAGEIWAMRNKMEGDDTAEEEISIRALKRTYARRAGISPSHSPEPREISKIARGECPGDLSAAREAFRRLGENLGDALANAITLLDGLVAVGGGIANAYDLFIPAVLAEMNGRLGKVPRLEVSVFDLDDRGRREKFLRGQTREISIPLTGGMLTYDPQKRVGIGKTRLGTERAVFIGAYIFALRELEGRE